MLQKLNNLSYKTSFRKIVGFDTVVTDITRKRALPEEATIHTGKMTAIKIALKEIQKKEDKRWVIYIDSMQFIEYNKKYHPILTQIYDISKTR